MATDVQKTEDSRSAGYAFLIQKFDLQVLPHWHISETGGYLHQKIVKSDGQVREIFPKEYWPGESYLDHFEFALKYDGINLEILSKVFYKIDADKLALWITDKPQGQYTRRIWYLYEWLKDKKLPIDDLASGNYIDLLKPKEYYTCQHRMIRRQRIRDNLPGNLKFCPLVRRTKILTEFENSNLSKQCREILSDYPEKLVKRAVSYLYTKETKSSYEIEHITPTATRAERFSSLLKTAEKDDFVTKEALIELQNRIVDPRYADDNYRKNQNYVGQTVAWQHEIIHFVPPKPEDLADLMEGLVLCHKKMDASEIHPVIHAAVISFGFVFLHPFGDGNGRIHRFLIHNILARHKFTPEGFIFPISAAMINDIDSYDDALESFSKPLMRLIDYMLAEDGKMEVQNQTALHYRYPDMTKIAEVIFQFIKMTIEKEMVDELDFLKNYDTTKTAIQSIVDMPDQRLDLFIRFCLQNNGILSQNKRKSYFSELSDDEIKKMQNAVQDAYQ